MVTYQAHGSPCTLAAGSSDIIIDIDVNYTGPPGGKTGKAFHAAYGGGKFQRTSEIAAAPTLTKPFDPA